LRVAIPEVFVVCLPLLATAERIAAPRDPPEQEEMSDTRTPLSQSRRMPRRFWLSVSGRSPVLSACGSHEGFAGAPDPPEQAHLRNRPFAGASRQRYLRSTIG